MTMEGRGNNKAAGLILFGAVAFGLVKLITSFSPKKVVLNWSYPRKFENGLYSELAYKGWGIYYISSKTNGKEKLLYIGKAYYSSFFERLRQHERNWLNNYPGEKYVRFGEFELPASVGESTVHDVESALILEHQPTHNTMQKSSYTYTHKRIIHSIGKRGLIKKIVKMTNH